MIRFILALVWGSMMNRLIALSSLSYGWIFSLIERVCSGMQLSLLAWLSLHYSLRVTSALVRLEHAIRSMLGGPISRRALLHTQEVYGNFITRGIVFIDYWINTSLIYYTYYLVNSSHSWVTLLLLPWYTYMSVTLNSLINVICLKVARTNTFKSLSSCDSVYKSNTNFTYLIILISFLYLSITT